ncbi:MAG: methylmalonyl Co-A mutase-associated GTPase MeaB [Methylococcales bacterium]|nr:MAG: methylmalonyl Co-A mutase-associated GTPase MeaB [Methylococcales bacterium]
MMNAMSADDIVEEILKGNRALLARAMTIIESTHSKHYQLADEILDKIMPLVGKAKRIGITGVPGSGKSTLLEALGMHLINRGLKVAIIAIDPSSFISGGSILGDKTRMTRLLREYNAFIRPVPSGGHLGGASRRTRELTFLFDAAGFDVVFIETVGVGQSEIEMIDLVDFFCLVQIPGAGDELQGIKKGIMEVADVIIINKEDGDNKIMAQVAKTMLKNALHILKPKYSEWQAPVLTCSARENTGIENIWEVVEKFYTTMEANEKVASIRKGQDSRWMKRQIEENIINMIYNTQDINELYRKTKARVESNQLSPRHAVETVSQYIAEKLTCDCLK